VTETAAALVSGGTKVELGNTAAESAMAWTSNSSGSFEIVTANVEDPSHILNDAAGTPSDYSDDTRTTLHNASMMTIAHRMQTASGFSAWSRQTIRPPTDWAVLWGDPSMVARGQYVFATNLAGQNATWPQSGGVFLPIKQCFTPRPGCQSTKGMEPYLNGACVARSSDYGQTFTLAEVDCFSDNGHFYDGSTMTASGGGQVFAAFFDVTAGQIDV
jgi:hypothetical protein